MLTIYHNPRCSKSRKALELLEDSGMSFEIYQYLKRPPKASELREIINLLGVKPIKIMRTGESILRELKIDLDTKTDDELIALMLEHPIKAETLYKVSVFTYIFAVGIFLTGWFLRGNYILPFLFCLPLIAMIPNVIGKRRRY